MITDETHGLVTGNERGEKRLLETRPPKNRSADDRRQRMRNINDCKGESTKSRNQEGDSNVFGNGACNTGVPV